MQQLCKGPPPHGQRPTPTAPWTRLHMDYAGPINGYYFFLIIDAYSKWPEIIKTKTTTAAKTIEIFAEVLARHGLSQTQSSQLCVTDNGPQFISTTFENFCKKPCIKNLTTAYYSSQSNGQTERIVELMKNGLHRAEGNLDQKLREFLNCVNFSSLTGTCLHTIWARSRLLN